jgi:hypothetical protein
VIQLSAKADPDGVLRLTVPGAGAGTEYEVAVVLHLRPAASTSPGAKTPEELGWPPGYFEQTYGSIDDETFVAPPRLPSEPVETIE